MRVYYFLITLCSLNASVLFGQKNDKCIHMCKLQDSIQSFSATQIDGSELFKIRAGQFFLYNTVSELAWLPNGNNGYIDIRAVLFCDSLPPFKMIYKWSSFQMNKNNDLRIFFRENFKTDIQNLVNRILKGSIIYFDKFLSYKYKLDGHYSEEFTYLTWRIINYMGDKGLLKYLRNKSLKNHDIVTRFFYDETLNTDPICNKDEYFSANFPRSVSFFVNKK